MKVKFVPIDKEVEIGPGESVLHAAHKNGIEIKSVCKGIPSCAECRIHIVEGEHNVLPPSNAELQLIGTAHFVDHRRLACQLRCFGDIVVDVSEQLEKLKAVAQKKEEGSQAVTGNIMMEGQNREDAKEREVQKIIEQQEKDMVLQRIKQERTDSPKTGFYKELWKEEKRDDRSGNRPRRDQSSRNRNSQSHRKRDR